MATLSPPSRLGSRERAEEIVPGTPETRLVATTERLQEVLQQREFHLAELIDEVVYAEAQRAVAEQGSASTQRSISRLENAFQQLLRFHIALSEEVVLPALLDTVRLRLNESVVLDPETRRALRELSASASLAPPTRQLLSDVLAADAHAAGAAGEAVGSSPAATSAAASPPSPSSGNTQKFEQAIVLAGLLGRKQRELLRQLEEVRYHLDPSVAAPVPATDGVALTSTGYALRLRSPPRYAAADEAHEAAMAALRRECDALRAQLTAREGHESVVASLLTDKRQLETELLYAQRRTLEEQQRGRDLRLRVVELEAAVQRAQQVRAAGLVETQEEVSRVCRGAELTRASLESEVARLRQENRALVEAGERMALQAPAGDTATRHTVAKLQGVVASLKADLHIMESRLAVIQDQRAAERARILAQFEDERQRLQRERDECQQLVSKMADELKLLARDHNVMRGVAAVEEL